MAAGFHRAFLFVIGLRVANFSPRFFQILLEDAYIYAPVTSRQGYSGTFLFRTTLKITWQLHLVLTALVMCSYNRREQLQHVFASRGVLNSVCFCFPACFDQQNPLSKRIYFHPCWSLPRSVAQHRGFSKVALLISWDHWLQLTPSYLLLKENPKMYCII